MTAVYAFSHPKTMFLTPFESLRHWENWIELNRGSQPHFAPNRHMSIGTPQPAVLVGKSAIMRRVSWSQPSIGTAGSPPSKRAERRIPSRRAGGNLRNENDSSSRSTPPHLLPSSFFSFDKLRSLTKLTHHCISFFLRRKAKLGQHQWIKRNK